MPLGYFIPRHYTLTIIEFKVTPVRDFKCVADGLRRVVLEYLPHFINSFKIEMVIEPQPVLIVDSLFCLYTKEHIVHFVVGFAEVVAIICGNEREIELFRQLSHHWICFKFLVYIVILHLNVEVIFPHYLHQRFEVLDTLFSPI